jgi:hypothetical protein
VPHRGAITCDSHHISVTVNALKQGFSLVVGSRVYLHGASFGAAGEVLRFERGKVVVSWSDLNFISRHHPDTQILAETNFDLSDSCIGSRPEKPTEGDSR